MITQGHDAGETAAIRMDPEYSKTQVALNVQLAGVPLGFGLSSCRAFSGGIHSLGAPITTPIRIPKLNGAS